MLLFSTPQTVSNEFNQFLKFSYDQYNLMLFDSIFPKKFSYFVYFFLSFLFFSVGFGFGLGFDLYDTVVV